MRTAVIISTYNQPVWLEKVLWGYAVQSRPDFDLVIADDGSEQGTQAVLERARRVFGNRLQHVWHEDQGFRKCEILNKAIVAAQADYLIFTDGDCIPRRDFVATHMRLAQPGRFLSGGVIWLPRTLSEGITQGDVESGRVSERSWLRDQGWQAGRHGLRLVRSRRAARVLDLLTSTAASFNGHNASVWRDALFAVNGFDAQMGYGGLDRALGERLHNLGLRGRQVRYRAVCLHLDHDRPYRRPEVVQRNHDLRTRIRRTGEVRAQLGTAELLSAVGRET
jgi:glycosyltransferase involved in cell wall biosynthesis